jgi:hypothetical protein
MNEERTKEKIQLRHEVFLSAIMNDENENIFYETGNCEIGEKKNNFQFFFVILLCSFYNYLS